MNLAWHNLLAWWVQIVIIVLICTPVPSLLRIKAPRPRLWYWHVILLVSLVLPFIEPFVKPAASDSAVTMTTGFVRIADHPAAGHVDIPWSLVAAVVLIGGVLLRFSWLGLGMYRLRSYRVSARPLDRSIHAARILVSRQISSPVTFGLRDPVVLLPERFLEFSEPERNAILSHELVHIRRHDWAVSICEEFVRSLFWFHPAIWWLLGRIQLTREQVVDEAVIRQTGDSQPYLDALLAIASLEIRADLAPAPLFLKKSHLRQRVESIVSGVPMTKRALLLPLAAAFATLPLIIGIAAWQFPLRAAPQEAVDDPGVEVQLDADKILHRTGVAYPEEARSKHVSGTVIVGVNLNEKGSVMDATVVSGPQELRRAVLQSVLNWHFASQAGSDVQVAVHFEASKGAPPGVAALGPFALNPANGKPASVTVSSFDTSRLPAALREKVEQVLPPAGDTLSSAGLAQLGASLRDIDDHLRTQGRLDREGKYTLLIALAGTQALQPQLIRVGGNVQSANLVTKVRPVYPPEAKAARIQGTVRFEATIGPDGLVKNLQVVAGDPLLVQAAMEGVKQWVYKPTLLNGVPVAVITTIDVNFTLAH